MKLSALRRLFLPVVAALGLSGFAVADPFRPGMQQQVELGQEVAKQVRDEEEVLPDSDPRVQEVRRIGERLVAALPEKERKERPFRYTFDVIESEDINAFALPGGPIFIYTGLLDRLETEDQIAGLIGHEMIHVRNQHWASQYADNTKRRLGIAVILTLLGAGQTAFDLAAVADTFLVTLAYSRRHETEADMQGLDLMISAGYNPYGARDLFRVLQEAGGGGAPEWASTHPDDAKRVGAIEKKIEEMDRDFPAQRARSNSKGNWRAPAPGLTPPGGKDGRRAA